MSLDHSMGHMRGKIVDIDGRGISGCRIWIRETGQQACADAHGNFVMINILPALYTIVVECLGYSLSVSPDIPIVIGDNPGFSAVMHALYPSRRMRNSFNANELSLQF